MSKLIIFRHAQASFGSQNYDQLSSLGFQQSKWLGQHLLKFDNAPNRFICGTLTRHKQTAHGILEGMESNFELEQDSAWNEFEFEGIVQAYLTQHPESKPKDKQTRSFFKLLKTAMLAWAHDEIELHNGESWNVFETRVKMAFQKLQNDPIHETTWLVTSGGVIAMLLAQILEASKKTMVELNLQTRNTSISEVYYKSDSQCMMTFNQLPHLVTKERADARTYA